MMDALLTIKELAQYLKVSVYCVRKWYAADRNFPVYRFGARTVRFDPEEVRRYVLSRQSMCGSAGACEIEPK